MAASTEKLTLAVASLARNAPQQWREFLAELDVYFDERKMDVLRAPVAELEKAQGRAQALMLLMDLFNDAVKGAERIALKTNRQSK